MPSRLSPRITSIPRIYSQFLPLPSASTRRLLHQEIAQNPPHDLIASPPSPPPLQTVSGADKLLPSLQALRQVLVDDIGGDTLWAKRISRAEDDLHQTRRIRIGGKVEIRFS